MSRSGWKRLKHARKRGAKSKAAVLRDTGLLLAALSPSWTGKPGAKQKNTRDGVIVGFGGPARHGNSRASIADIASFHQVGAGVLPVREIITKGVPSLAMRRMAAAANKELKDNARDSSI